MNTIPVYQADANGFFLYESKASELALDPGNYNIPFGAVVAAPPKCPAGEVARLVNGEWAAVEDHRDDTLYVVGTNAKYTLGSVVDGQSYDGGGPLPEWLTDVEPAPTEEVGEATAEAPAAA